MPRNLLVTIASKGHVITRSGFSGYDCCLNPYVGCEIGCSYCYVRFFVKDANAEWGEFVRLRQHVVTKLPGDLQRWAGQRLVMGTMTDPYQPLERRHRLTRAAIDIINASPHRLQKVGIYTRSPIILDDLDAIAKLPRARVHFTITPYPRDVITKLEPIAIQTYARFDAVRKIKAAGIRVHVNVAPVLPVLSTRDQITEFAAQLADIGVDEFFVDPMQAYPESLDATFSALRDMPEWPEIARILRVKGYYENWKTQYGAWWFDEWQKYRHLPILPILADHITHGWIDMRTMTPMNRHAYGDDLANPGPNQSEGSTS